MKKGFTLIETIIYIALMALLISGGVVTTFYVADSAQKNKSDVNIQAEGNFIVRKIEWAVTGASDLSIPSVTELLVTKPSGNLNFKLNNSNPLDIYIELNGSRLSSSRVTIAGGTMFAPTAGLPKGVTVNFTVNNKPFTLTKYLRK
ncbi:MAG TPA: prepilin-type N-terminal cleavage/methylation domain-containing protein [Candidatus Paceibacterota bacterium]